MSRILVIVLVLAVALTIGAVPAGAQPRVPAQPDAPQDLQQLSVLADFDGDGNTDLAVGAPQENVGATLGAGAVSIFYGIAAGTGLPSASQTLVQANVEAGDQFGAALTAEFFTADVFEDLVVGAPGENVGVTLDAGAANLFASTGGGGLPAVSGPALLQANPEAGDQFGAALTTKFLNGGAFPDLVVGAPGEDVGATVDAGAVNVLANVAGALPAVTSQTLAQANPEADDQFGTALDT